MITELEIIKNLVLNNGDFKYELDTEAVSKSSSRISQFRVNKLEKDSKNQLFQTIYIQWGAYVKELKKQINEQMKKQDTFVFDSKIAGNLLIKDGIIKIVDEEPTIDFDFEKLTNKIGVDEDQIVQNLSSFMDSAQ